MVPVCSIASRTQVGKCPTMLLRLFIALMVHLLLCSRVPSVRGLIPPVLNRVVQCRRGLVPTSSTHEEITTRTPLHINIYVDSEVRSYLNMANHERKSRLVLPKNREEFMEQLSVDSVRQLVEKKLLKLVDQPYALRYALPGVMDNSRTFRDNDDVVTSFAMAESGAASGLNLYVESRPGSFPPPSEPYLQGMPDPSESTHYTIVSFYRFGSIADPEEFSQRLGRLFRPFRAHGRVYVAHEGVNAQCAVPSNVLQNFHEALESWEFFNDQYLNPDHRMTRADYEAEKPFKAMHIRVRDQVVADGLDAPLDWTRGGNELEPMEWHAALDTPGAVVLDCRNSYESDVGMFEGAIPLNTTFFRESWEALDSILENRPKDVPILTYCTGGIRCIKTNAYIEQKLGFTNVNRLQGGIISYARALEAAAEDGTTPADGTAVMEEASHRSRILEKLDSKFRGVNYVFDERMGVRITDDVLSVCETCGTPCDAYTNCNNFDCHVRFIQCATCTAAGSYSGCCSLACSRDFSRTLADRGGYGRADGLASKPEPLVSRALHRRTRAGGEASHQQSRLFSSSSSSSLSPGVIDATFPADAETASGPTTTATTAASNFVSASAATSTSHPQQTWPKLELKDHASAFDAHVGALNEYCERHSTPEPSLLAELRVETRTAFGQAARMVSGPLQGRLLVLLSTVARAQRCLELGSFTGYSALCLAEAVAPMGGEVVACEPDSRAASIARKYFARSGAVGKAIRLREMKALELMSDERAAMSVLADGAEREAKLFDVAFVDADKKAYLSYVQELVGDAIDLGAQVRQEAPALVQTMTKANEWSSSVESYRAPLLRDGALIIVDNTLWKGLVLEHEPDLALQAPPAEIYGNALRMRKLADGMHAFSVATNGAVGPVEDGRRFRLTPVMLPLRDGLTVLRFASEPAQ